MKKKGEIVFTQFGPYRAVDTKLIDKDGNELETPRVFSLCRCGQSDNKPFCDGSHNKVGFMGNREKEDKRGTKTYQGEKISIRDNRHICCHHGTCNLEGVFDSDMRPWINPDGSENIARIIEVIEKCPSGALSYIIDGEIVDSWHKEQEIIVSKDGPLHVRGYVEIKDDLDSDKNLVCREHYTLCRCGKSKNKPFCDGAHHDAGFKG